MSKKRGNNKKLKRDSVFLIRVLADEPGFFSDYLDVVFSTRKEAEKFIAKAAHPLAEDQDFTVVEFIELQ